MGSGGRCGRCPIAGVRGLGKIWLRYVEGMDSGSFEYLWDGTEEGWVLVHVGKGPLPVIFNRVTRMALIIDEDDELYASVVQQMIDHGKEVLKELPLARVPVACQNRAEPADIER